MVTSARLPWILLSYRVPREPSAPRIAIWRRVRRLGASQIADGLIALPDDSRTREHLEWLADQVLEAGGRAVLFRGETLTLADQRDIAHAMAEARSVEYESLVEAAGSASHLVGDLRAARRRLSQLRSELREIQRRDYFPPPARDRAEAAIAELAARIAPRQESIACGG